MSPCRIVRIGPIELAFESAATGEWVRSLVIDMSSKVAYQTIVQPPGLEQARTARAIRDPNSPKLLMDAHLVAFAIQAGLRIITADKTFARFHGLDPRVLEAFARDFLLPPRRGAQESRGFVVPHMPGGGMGVIHRAGGRWPPAGTWPPSRSC